MIPRRSALLLPLLAIACGDMRPEPPARLPPGIVEGATDPGRFAVETAAHVMLDRPQALYGNAAEAAFASGLVEHAATAFQDGAHADGWHVTRLLREGRTALRNLIGIRPETLPQEAQDALLAAAAALRRRDMGAAEAALAPILARGARPLSALSTLEVPPPLRRALREAREMLRRSPLHGN